MTGKSKPRVYIAGPIRKGDLVHNIRQSDEAFEKLVKAGFAPMNPMWSCFAGSVGYRVLKHEPVSRVTALGTTDGNLSLKFEDWIGMDLAWVSVSDAVLRLPGESSGADMETAHAKEKGIPVFTDIDKLIAAFAPPRVWTLESPKDEWAIGDTDVIIDDITEPDGDEGERVVLKYLGGQVEEAVIEATWAGKFRNIPSRILGGAFSPALRSYGAYAERFANKFAPTTDCRVYVIRRTK